jgi:hypothetical protein
VQYEQQIKHASRLLPCHTLSLPPTWWPKSKDMNSPRYAKLAAF